MTPLDRRTLNRTTLSRQLLLDRASTTPHEVVRHLVGLQAQDPEPPYVGLWSRIADFTMDGLTDLLHDRAVVRGTMFRGTQHLVTADDYRWLRPTLQPLLTRWQRGAFGRSTAGLDLEDLTTAARDLLAGGAVSRPELARALGERRPGRDPVGLARSVQGLLPILHPPPDGVWGRRGPTPFVLAEQWLGGPLAERPDTERLVLRYLAAFGPASVRDVQAWSGMTRLRSVLEDLRSRLVVRRDGDGRELFDLPDAPVADRDTPAPVRFMAVLDNVLVGYDDRSRLVADHQRVHLMVHPPVTVDGFVRGLWRIGRDKETGAALLEVRLFEPLSPAEEDAVTGEGLRLLRFAAPDTTEHDLRLRPLDP